MRDRIEVVEDIHPEGDNAWVIIFADGTEFHLEAQK